MPNNNTEPAVPQAMPQQGLPPQTAQQSQGKAPDPEKMLIEMLKEMEQNIQDLNQRVDVLEQKSGQPGM